MQRSAAAAAAVGKKKKEEKGEGRKHLDSLVKFAHLEQVLVSARAS